MSDHADEDDDDDDHDHDHGEAVQDRSRRVIRRALERIRRDRDDGEEEE